MFGATKVAPPSGGAVASSQSHAPATSALVPCVGLVEDPQRLLDRGGLAVGRAAVRLERLAEAAVGVAVGGDGGADGLGVAAEAEPLEAAQVEDAGAGREEMVGCVEIWHARI